jgi:hypothetical protein
VSGAPDPEAAYFQSIEEFFVSRRGDPLTLSNADWVLIRSWRRAGIPLRVVLRGITDALDGHAHSWSRGQRVGSLRYCAREVEAARERWERALALGTEPEGGIPGALRGFARALRDATGLGPLSAAFAHSLVPTLEARAEDPGPAREVEAWLQASEHALLDRLSEDAGEAVEKHLAASVEADLAPYRSRLPPRVLEQVRKDGRARRLLESQGLPRLSLFHL